MYPNFWRRYIRVGILTRMYPCIFVGLYSILRAVFPVGTYVPTLVLVGTYVPDFVFCPAVLPLVGVWQHYVYLHQGTSRFLLLRAE